MKNKKFAVLLLVSFLTACTCARKGEETGMIRSPSDELHFKPSKIETEEVTYEREDDLQWPFDPKSVIQPERLAKTVMEFLPIPSRSCEEILYTLYAKRLLEEVAEPLDIQVAVDELPRRIETLDEERRQEYYCNNGLTPPNSGNLIAYIPGDKELPSWNLSVHLDTNQSSFDGMKREGDLIRPAPGTALGADDKAGMAIIIEILRVIAEQKIPHGDIRIVGLVAEEQTASGVQLIDADAFRGDILISIDGTDPLEIGRAGPTMYEGVMIVRTSTSHPMDFDEKKSVSACAVGSRLLHETGFRPEGHPPNHPMVILHSAFVSCGEERGELTPKGEPTASYKYNTVSPYWTANWQMRSLEGHEAAARMVSEMRTTMERICLELSQNRTPVRCEIRGAEKPDLYGYLVEENHPSVILMNYGIRSLGISARVTAKQFGGFNGNYVFSRFGEEMLSVGTGADQIHTNEETVSVEGMAKVARSILAAMIESYHYRKDD
ncbi:MAG: M20/M25/M40 family metallo-hydrolase [Deltaproteobacteria bacterium]|nr:M20/M25/M40 family metallo-hydrolase [Deltaproteobacteria bacterium]